MKIRWSIVLLALFGVVAAIAAAVLTASLSAQGIQAAVPDRDQEIKVLTAAHDMKAMAIIRAEDLVTKVLPADAAPANYYTDPAQVVGRVLSLAVVEGQTLTKNTFPAEGSGLLLAAQLPAGKRAVAVSLNDHSGLEGLLYPGCIVDVVASFRVDGADRIGTAVSTTLLQNIQVLGVENNTIVNKETEEKDSHASRGVNHTLLVTVMVDSKQAEALQLAMEHGVISLAMRNPSDAAVAVTDATLLAEGKLAQLAELLSPKVGDRSASEEEVETALNAGTPPAQALAPQAAAPAKAADDQRLWQIDVIRGMKSETRSFPVQN